MSDYGRILARSEPFQALDEDLLSSLLDSMIEQSFDPGQPLILQGTPGEGLLVLVSGRASVHLRGQDGVPHRVAEVGPGDVVGEMALITGEMSSAEVVALDPVRTLMLPADRFDQLARTSPHIAVVLTRIIADRLGGDGLDALGDKVVQGFRIVRCVGQGGMAVVYEAIRLSDGKTIALKMMSHRLIYDGKSLGRFQEEARVLDTLRHENLVRLHGHFSAYGTRFLVMEFCCGPSLDRITARRTPFPEEKIRPLIGQMSGVLDYVHRQGVLHRDVKPGNIMLAGGGIAKLADFGLARSMLLDDSDTQTLETSVIGTPYYMAPEQFRHVQVDARADHYSLGCVIYELLGGNRLVTAKDMYSIMEQKMQFQMPPRDELGLGISIELHALLRDCLSPDPAKRPTTLADYAGWAGPVDLGA